MVIVEGRGRIAPCPRKINLDEHEIGILLNAAIERRKHRADYSAKSTWKRGLTGQREVMGRPIDSATVPIFVGLVGEWSVSRLINQKLGFQFTRIDLSLHDGDDGSDVIAGMHKIQVKTRVNRGHGRTLIRRMTRQRSTYRIVPMSFHHLVCCEYTFGDNCLILGWMEREKMRELKVSSSHISRDWFNLVVNDFNLESVGSLLDRLSWQNGI